MSVETTSLARELELRTQETLILAEPAIRRLIKAAHSLKMERTGADLERCLASLERPEFRLIVFGLMKSGKSTFLNLLLGQLEHHAESAPLPMAQDPATALVTTVSYGPQPRVFVVLKDGGRKEQSLAWLREAILEGSEDEIQRKFQSIASLEVEWPFPNGRAGIVLIDTPGTNEAAARTAEALQALESADAAILMYRTWAGGITQNEMEYTQAIRDSTLKRTFSVVNYSVESLTKQQKLRFWDNLVRELRDGPANSDPSAADFAQYGIYFVDAKSALQARVARDDAALAATGLPEFERVLNAFINSEPRKVQVERWTGKAIVHADAILAEMQRTVGFLMQRRETIEAGYALSLGELARIKGRRGIVKRLFRAFRDQAITRLDESFKALVKSMCDELPRHLELAELTSLPNFRARAWAALNPRERQRVTQEAFAIAERFVEEQMAAWDAAGIIRPLLAEFAGAIEEETRKTRADFDKIDANLTGGLLAERKPDEGSNLLAKVGLVALGGIFGPDMMVIGAHGDLGKFGKNLLLHFGVFVILGAAFAGSSAIVVPAWIITVSIRTLFGGLNIDAEIKSKVASTLIEGVVHPKTRMRVNGLKADAQDARTGITAALDAVWLRNAAKPVLLAKFVADLSDDFDRELDDKISAVERTRKESEQEDQEKKALIAKLRNDLTETTREKETLLTVKRAASLTVAGVP